MINFFFLLFYRETRGNSLFKSNFVNNAHLGDIPNRLHMSILSFSSNSSLSFLCFAIGFLLCYVSYFSSRLLDSSQQLRGRLLSVSLGVVADPPPEVLTGLLHGELSLPVQLGVGQSRVGSQIQDIAGSAGNDLVFQIAPNDSAECLDDLEDGAATARAQVPGLDTGLVGAKVVESDQVASGKIDNVNVVSDGGSVARGVVCRKNVLVSISRSALHARIWRECHHSPSP